MLDLEICEFCHRLNILNLGWKPFGKYYCKEHEGEHLLCPELCHKTALNILECELVRKRTKPTEGPVKPNKPYDWANCYLCGKELRGAGKHGAIKNRNNPGFWGVSSSYKILCLECLGRRYYKVMKSGKRKTFNKYLRRGYV